MEYFNILFHGLHLATIFVNLFGWAIVVLRRVTLLVQTITIGLWAGFGYWKGWWGYCPLTDWHWQVKRAMGEKLLPGNYVSYILEHWGGLNVPSDFVRGMILGSFAIAVVANLYFVIRRSN